MSDDINQASQTGQTDEPDQAQDGESPVPAKRRMGVPRKPRVAPDSRLERAVAAENVGDAETAIEAYRREIAADPNFGLAHAGLGSLLLRIGRLEAAVESLTTAARLLPTNPSPPGSLAMALLRLGRASEARVFAKRVTELTPTAFPAYRLLADCCQAAKDLRGLVEAYTAAHEALPTNAEVLLLLAKAMINANRNERAVNTLKAAFERIKPTPTLLGLMGDAYLRQNKIEEALDAVNRALAMEPESQYAVMVLARVRWAEDKADEAGALLEKLTPPLESPAVVTFAQVRRRQKREAEAEQMLLELLERANAMDDGLMSAKLVLGSIRESQGRYDEAFEFYKGGNDASLARFDPEGTRKFIDSLIDVYHAWKAPTYARGDPTDVPIFIVGMPRSGTSLVEQILASHPEVFAAGELSDLEIIAQRACRRLGIQPRPYPIYMPALTREQVLEMGRPYLDRIRATAPGATRHTDKMPHNFRHVGMIWQLFPNARIIHCRRDPIDTCLSCYSISFNASHAYSNSLEGLAFMYAQYRRLMQHWRTSLPLNLLEVVYEDLVHSPEEWSRKIVDFAGLPWNEKCLDFHKTKRAVLTASVDQVRRPVYDSSIGRWQKFEPHLKPLIDAMGDLAHVPG
ncbi:MAG: sulfotransferase [Phycisphaerales bacterium]|jgi:tetratricopeptide (TPR) repeat protein|nr:sulfotransferase [Phycisphaerales bacterium]